MPMIHIAWLPRDTETKRNVAKAITKALVEEAGCQPEAVHIAFCDTPKENFAHGGVLLPDQK